MTRFDKAFCWAATIGVIVPSCYFVATTDSPWQAIFVAGMSTACVYVVWNRVATESRKQKLYAARRRFDAAAVAFMRALDNGVAGSPSRWTAEGRELLAAWNDYHQELDGTAELVRRLRR